MTAASNESEQTSPPSAYLIVNSEVFPLRDGLTNIGRKLDNNIVIHDPRVSRDHAQIQLAEGQFIILDLNSTGGTTVNGKNVNRSVLYPGDTISLAGVVFKFIQDVPRMISKSTARTGPLSINKYEESASQTSQNNET